MPMHVRLCGFDARGRTVSKSKGFTLIELMVVVAIVAILAAIALPSYQEQVRKSRRAQARADLAEIVQGLERSFTVNRGYDKYDLPFKQSPREAADGAGFYDIKIDPQEATTYKVIATAKGAQASDRCGDLSIDNLGVKKHSEGSDSDCSW